MYNEHKDMRKEERYHQKAIFLLTLENWHYQVWKICSYRKKSLINKTGIWEKVKFLIADSFLTSVCVNKGYFVCLWFFKILIHIQVSVET